MNTDKIKFIRKYCMYRMCIYEVIYKSGRCLNYSGKELSKTARQYIAEAEAHGTVTKQPYIFDGEEIIYEK